MQFVLRSLVYKIPSKKKELEKFVEDQLKMWSKSCHKKSKKSPITEEESDISPDLLEDDYEDPQKTIQALDDISNFQQNNQALQSLDDDPDDEFTIQNNPTDFSPNLSYQNIETGFTDDQDGWDFYVKNLSVFFFLIFVFFSLFISTLLRMEWI